MEDNIGKDFSFDSINDFDSHISKSIPGYNELINVVINMTDYFIVPETNVYDLGCSTGKLLDKIQSPGAKKIGIDNSKNLLPKNNDTTTFLDINLNEPFIMLNSSMIISLFTLQFLEKKNRLRVLKEAYNGLNKGGALILAEKIYSRESIIQDTFTFLYYDFKQNNFTPEDILGKENALRKILRPLTHEENIELLVEAGFKKWDVFWRRFNFEALVCIK